MRDSKDPYNSSKNHPIQSGLNTIADVENMIFGTLGFAFFVGGAFVFLYNGKIIGSICCLLISFFCLFEIFRARLSYSNKGLIKKNETNPSKELEEQMKKNDKKIKLYNKIKIYCLLLFLFVIIGYFTIYVIKNA